MNRKLVVLFLICMLLTMAVAPAFADCTGYDPCPNGPYGSGDINLDAMGWLQIFIEIFSSPWW